MPVDWLDRYDDDYEEGWHAVREARFNRQMDMGVIPAHASLAPEHRAMQAWDTLLPAQRQVELKRMRIYAAMIENMDHHIGRLLAALDERRSDRETFIIFVSDNGAEGNAIDGILDNAYWIPSNFDNRIDNIGRRDSYQWLGLGWAQASVAPFRLYKSYTTAGGLRTPAIVYSTAGRTGNGMMDAVVTVRDIAPTILDLAGVAAPDGEYDGREVHRMSGASLLEYLGGRTDTVHGNEPLGWELYGSRALVKGEWKAVRIFPPDGSGEWEISEFEVFCEEFELCSTAAAQRAFVSIDKDGGGTIDFEEFAHWFARNVA